MIKHTCIIVDDEPQAIELLADSIRLFYKNIEIIHTFTHWTKALEALRNVTCDILFLDISMQDKNGMDLLRLVPNLQSEVVFITAHTDYALDAFKFSAAGYIVKPVDNADLITTVDKTLERINNKKLAHRHNNIQSHEAKIGIPNSNSIEYLNINDIIYLEAEKSYTNVIAKGKTILSSYNLQKFITILDEQLFFQVHRSYVINLNHISRYETTGTVTMINDSHIPVAKNSRENFLKLFTRVAYDDISR